MRLVAKLLFPLAITRCELSQLMIPDVCQSVSRAHLSVTRLYVACCANTTGRIDVRLAVETFADQTHTVLDRGPDPETARKFDAAFAKSVFLLQRSRLSSYSLNHVDCTMAAARWDVLRSAVPASMKYACLGRIVQYVTSFWLFCVIHAVGQKSKPLLHCQ